MDSERQRQLRGHLGRGVVLSFLVHASFVLPLLALVIVLGNREAAEAWAREAFREGRYGEEDLAWFLDLYNQIDERIEEYDRDRHQSELAYD